MTSLELGFPFVTDARDPSTGLPVRQPSDGLPSRSGISGDPRARESELGGRGPFVPARGADLPPRGADMPPRGADMPPRGADIPPRGADRAAFPVRQPTRLPPRPGGGRHRRAVPASLPQSAPALVLGVPGRDVDLSAGPVGELAAVLRVDNPAVEVRAARIDGGGVDNPSDLRSVLADAAARRPDGGPTPCAVVIPLIATVNPPVIRRLREAVAAMANVTSVLLAARLALPVITASVDSAPSIHEGAMRLKEMGVNRLAVAPCFIGPEATRRDLDALHALGADCAKPIGAHGNIAKLAALTYGQAISQLDLPYPGSEEVHGAHE